MTKSLWTVLRPLLSKITNAMPEKTFMNLLYWEAYRRIPNLTNPRTFDEKLQWYKLYYRDPLMTKLADKYAVREYISDMGLAGILNELYNVYDTADEIDFSRLPKSFILKATHGSGMNIICKDKEKLNLKECRNLLNKWLKVNYYYCGREWAYKNIRPRIICEKYLENEEFDELVDYKFYCYNDKPEVLFVCTGRFSPEGVKHNAYDMNWKRIYAYKGKSDSDLAIEKPDNLQEMIDVARVLCAGFPFIRVDLYSVKGEIKFGELTFYPDSGLCPFTPDEYNYFFGDLFILPDKRIMS